MGFNGITSKIISQKKKFHKLIIFNLLESCQCGICHEFLSVPMMMSCGHNYCYRCIKNWFMSNATKELNCPSCRDSIVNEPCLNLMIEQTLHNIFDILKKRKKKIFKEEKDKTEFEELLKERFDDDYYYKKDKTDNTLFDNIFQNSALAITDVDDDGIPRCSNCHWELEPEDMEDENVCPHCHSRIRNNTSNLTSRSINLNSRPIIATNRDDYSDGEYNEIVSEIRNYNHSDLETSGESDSSESVGYKQEDSGNEENNLDEHDSELDSFIVDDDDEQGESTTQLSDGEGKRTFVSMESDEDRDSDYYEHNDSYSFVSGDSLEDIKDSQPVELVEIPDDREDLVKNVKRQRRAQVILSDDE